MTMNAEVYEQKRNELINLISGVKKIEGIDQATLDVFESTKDKLLANQFEIVLVAAFQGGKSTTFNALCGGREISPRGAMVKTSACVISATSLPNKATEEYSEIEWFCKNDLVDGLHEVLKTYFLEKEPSRFSSLSKGKKLSDILDIDKKADLALIKEAIKAEWKRWKTDPASYGDDGQLDLLRTADLVATFYNSEELKALKKKKNFPIKKVQDMVAFPLDWQSRWNEGSALKFKFKEIIFAFIRKVHCHIHSEYLQKIGCTITDCPGLFASRRDTERALEAMRRSDAIWFLLGGDKTIDQSTVEQLKTLHKHGLAWKLFYSVNMRASKKSVVDRFLPENHSIIENRGIKMENKVIHPYHALLAHMAHLGKLVQLDQLDEFSTQAFLRNAQLLDYDTEQPIQEVCEEVIDDSLRMLKVPSRKQVEDLETAVKYARIESGFTEVIDEINQHVISQKAEAILVKNGSRCLIDSIHIVKARLEEKEMAAKQTECESIKKFEDAQSVLNDFVGSSNDVLHRYLPEQATDKLTSDFFEKVHISLVEDKSFLSDLANQVRKEFGLVALALKPLEWVKLKPSRKETVKQILSEAVEKALTEKSDNWLQLLAQGKNKVYSENFSEPVIKIANKLNEQYGRNRISALTGSPEVQQFEIGKDFSTLSDTDIVHGHGSDIENGELLSQLLHGGGAAAVFGGIAFFLPGIGITFTLVMTAVLVVYSKCFKDKTTLIDKLSDALEDSLNKSFLVDRVEIEKGISSKLACIRERIIGQFKKRFEGYKANLENKKKVAQEQYKKDLDERIAMAVTAHLLRSKQIQPALDLITSYESSVEAAIGK